MLNKIMLIGHLGKDPDFNVTPDGTPVAKFSLAVTRSFGSKNSSGERTKETDWFNIVAWRSLAEICEKYSSRGNFQRYANGRLDSRFGWLQQLRAKRLRLRLWSWFVTRRL